MDKMTSSSDFFCENNDGQVDFFDPHFHIWDVSECHCAEVLAEAAEAHPKYLVADYTKHMEVAKEYGFRFVGGTFVEALPKEDDGPAELEWALKHFKEHGQGKFALVGRINLSLPNAKEQLLAMKALGAVGVRQIINYEPSWPGIERNAFKDPTWVQSVALLPECGINVFELHCNPHQLEDAELLVRRFPQVRFVVNHLACYKDGKDSMRQWYTALRGIAQYPNAYLKISNPTYSHSPDGFGDSEELEQMVRKAIDVFTPQRCMAASNYPVSEVGSSPAALFQWLRDRVLDGLSQQAKEAIMARTAIAVYGFADFDT